MNRIDPTIAALMRAPWAALPETARSILALTPQTAAPVRRASRYTQTGPHVSIIGPILGNRPSWLTTAGFGICTADIGRQLTLAAMDDSVDEILIEFDTPGGSVVGIPELTDEIRSAAKVKPITCFVAGTCASAGYWLASQGSRIIAQPSSVVGSIGVYVCHEDVSKALDAAGINMTLISAGEFKVEANPFQPLTGEAKAYLQSSVDDIYRDFTGAVARGRGVPIETVRQSYGRGRVLSASDALRAGMIDSVSATLRSAGRTRMSASQAQAAVLRAM